MKSKINLLLPLSAFLTIVLFLGVLHYHQSPTITPSLARYTDQENGFSLIAPAGLAVTRFNYGISIGIYNGPGTSIEVLTKKEYSYIEKWLEEANARLEQSRYVIDGNITIAGYSGISAHEVSDYEEYLSPKILIFETDKKIFVIRALQEQVETIIESFRLE